MAQRKRLCCLLTWGRLELTSAQGAATGRLLAPTYKKQIKQAIIGGGDWQLSLNYPGLEDVADPGTGTPDAPLITSRPPPTHCTGSEVRCVLIES